MSKQLGIQTSGDEATLSLYDTPSVKRDADELVGILGERFERLVARAVRGMHSKTPPSVGKLHTLAQAVAIVHDAPNDFVPRRDSSFDHARSELRASLSLVRGWVNSPEWSSISRAMSTEYPHILGALGLLRWLTEHQFEDDGYRAELAPEGDERKADIRLLSPEGEIQMLEVKLPRELMRPSHLTLDTARPIVESSFGQAGSSTRGQLRASDAPTLVIAGLWLSDENRETVLSAIVEERPRWRRLRPHVYSVGVLGIDVRATPIEENVVDGHTETIWSARTNIDARFVIPPNTQGLTFIERSKMDLSTSWRRTSDGRIID